MKFARDYEAGLQNEQYPSHWITSSISYRQLKKCIRKIQSEIQELGLDPIEIKKLLHPAVAASAGDGHFRSSALGFHAGFQPKLTFMLQINEDGLVDAALSPKTKITLQNFVAGHRVSSERRALLSPHVEGDPSPGRRAPQESVYSKNGRLNSTEIIKIEVPLRNNKEFFQIFQHGLSGLNALYDQEETVLVRDIGELGQKVAQVAVPSRTTKARPADLYAWRAVFELYLECNVFFSASDNEKFSRSPTDAQNQLQLFSTRLDTLQKDHRFRKKDSGEALQLFLLVNANLLRNLKFRQLNVLAAEKILKKLDKRTSLGARYAFIAQIDAGPFSPQTMAKSMCARISNEILAIVPQLNDYLCPVCFSISYKPIRLRCGHVFCIRCVVVLQRSLQMHCPLCRGKVVMQADSGNLDAALVIFLKAFFPIEVKQKQKDNERSAGVDRYGNDFEKCILM